MSHFNDKSIRLELEKKKHDFLLLALEAYTNANVPSSHEENEDTTADKHAEQDMNPGSSGRAAEETSSMSSSADKSGSDQNTKKGGASAGKTPQFSNEDEHTEVWLHHYMLGKIKEKLNPFDIMDSLNHYFQVS